MGENRGLQVHPGRSSIENNSVLLMELEAVVGANGNDSDARMADAGRSWRDLAIARG